MAKRKSTVDSSIKLPDGNVRKALIGALLVDPKIAVWPIEMRMINCLLKKHNDPEFWFFVAKHHKFVTLRNLLAQEHIIFHQRLEYTKQKSLELKKSETVKLSTEKVGEDIIVPQKQKTLLDFINS